MGKGFNHIADVGNMVVAKINLEINITCIYIWYMKVIIDLSPRALKLLKDKANEAKRSRKNYMELVLTIHAAKIKKQKQYTTKN